MNERDNEATPTPKWKNYQNEVAAFLSSLGFVTKTDENLQGARAEHDIDVTARISVASLPQLWIVECKRWNRPVPKERVLTFIALVNDIGADRGLMFAEGGFQAGAIRAATNTNITLTSLLDFKENASGEITELQVKALDHRAATLSQKLLALCDLSREEYDRIENRIAKVGLTGGLGNLPPGASTIGTRISQMRQSLEDARSGRWPVAYWALDYVEFEVMSIAHWEGLLFTVTETLATCERIYDYAISNDGKEMTLTDLQSSELTEMLAAVRASYSGHQTNRVYFSELER